ncbi:MAG TPA: hypothetical protein VIN38_04755 [Thiobacillus sp.]
MSLLLKALKQAEAANAAKPDADRAGLGERIEGSLKLEPLSDAEAESTPEWVEPPGLLFGNLGVTPEITARPSPAFRWPQLSLVPLVALLASLIAVGYGIYLYFALQPADAMPPPPVNVAPDPSALPTVSSLPASPPPNQSTPMLPSEPASAVVMAVPAVQPRAVPAETVSALSPPPPAAVQRSPDTASSAPTQRARDNTSGARTTVPPATAAPLQFQPDVQSALLSQAYAAYQRGALPEAQRLYTQAAARNRSEDVLLGLAAIASVQNRETEAQRLYREVLDLNPRNATAQAALLDLLGNTDSLATESRLKTLIDRDPSPQLFQTLGNLYADQKRWSDAQVAYFEAYRYAPDNADYAFNLAISLDQLRQSTAALRYYEKAIAIGGVHRFDRAQAEARIQQLKTAR